MGRTAGQKLKLMIQRHEKWSHRTPGSALEANIQIHLLRIYSRPRADTHKSESQLINVAYGCVAWTEKGFEEHVLMIYILVNIFF